ncbi:MAG: cysteine--tRNA ligase [Mycobacteriales bacterium]
MRATVRLYNSLGRRVEDFTPLTAGRVGLYTCGPTVYGFQHLGNLRPYVFSDTLRRLLEWRGLAVTQVVNITDVGHTVGEQDLGADKVEEAAKAELRSVEELTGHYAQAWRDDLAAVNVLAHTHQPKASEHVPRMIEFAKALEAKGFTYPLPSGLYFDTSRSPGYGRLALADLEGQRSGSRIGPVEGKRNAADFALWRADAPGERRVMRWDSPWGPGVPGWHLECSVMSMDLLGERFDVHTGGVDHRQVHHVNEIAQSEAYLGTPWVPYWLHNEFVLVGGAKIAKSAGRMPLLSDLRASGYAPMAYRWFLLTAQYRSQLDLTAEGLHAASAAYRRLLARVVPLRPLPSVPTADAAHAALAGRSPAALAAAERIDAALADDLNTPKALAELQGVLRDDTLDDAGKAVVVAAADQLLGLRLGDLDPDELAERGGELTVPVEYVEELVAAREVARAERRWPDADRLRDQLRDLGVRVTDTPDGPRWSAAPPG